LRLVHWHQIPNVKGAISGMLRSIEDLIQAEQSILGVRNVVLCDTDSPQGRPVTIKGRVVKTGIWEEVLNDPDSVHIIHTYSPRTLYDMKRKVVLTHGVPEYCWWDDILGIRTNWWQITTLVRLCDATISWFKRDTEFWSELGNGNVHAIRRGVDLKYYCPEGEKTEHMMRPHLLYADTMRLVKMPFSLLFAMRKIQRTLSQAHLRIVLSEPAQNIGWSNLITNLEIEHLCPIIFGMVDDPRPMFRGVDIGVSPVMWGLTSRVPVEMNACGTPAICFKGLDDSPIYGARVEDSPEAIAAGVFRLWDRIQTDQEGEKIRARKLAVKNWDIKDTAKAIIKVCEGVM
jgi:hypothetical protein